VILDAGSAEPLKGAVHGALGVLAAVCALYNCAALARRREPHLAINAAIYLALTAFETKKVRHHCGVTSW
jgi:hypothetical protein